MLADQGVHQRQAETGTFARAKRIVRGLLKGLSDARQGMGRNADPAVAHGDCHRFAFQHGSDVDLVTVAREFDGV